MRKLIVILFVTTSLYAQGQDAIRKNGFGINQDYNDYNVKLTDRKFTSFDSSLSNTIRISYGRYLNRNWEFNAGLANGFILNQKQGDHFIKKSYNLGIDFDIIFKINNGVFIPQDARIGPYLSFGYNLNYLKAFKDVGLSPYTLGNEYGVGMKIRLGSRSYINLHTALDQQLSGDFDTHMQYRIGFNQSIGKRSEESVPVPEDQKDYDGDGIADIDDNCPTIVGIDSNFGCPVDWVSTATFKGEQDSLLLKLDKLELEIASLLNVIDSLQSEGPIVQVEYAKVDSTISDKSGVGEDKTIPKSDTTLTKSTDVVIAKTKPDDGIEKDPGKQPTTKTTPVVPETAVAVIKEYYDRSEIGVGYYVVAISTKDVSLAERIAVLLDKDYPIVKVLPQANGFYRVGIYATKTRSEAISILEYAKLHGVPSGWLTQE